MKVGEQALDFALRDGDGEEWRLSDHRGRTVVLLFYPGDFTFICPTEFADAAAHYDQFTTLGAELLSVSTDSAFAHKTWHDVSPSLKQVRYPMIADNAGKLSRYFGTYVEEFGICVPASFIIDPDGVIRACEFHDNRIGRSIEEVLRKLQAAIFVRGHEDELCPANWRPGAETLKPAIELVGKI